MGGGWKIYDSLFGANNVTPKFHVAMHFPKFYRDLKARGLSIPTCWTCERKHRLPKRWINPITNTKQRFDRSAFRDVLGYSLAQLEEHEDFVKLGLAEPSVSPPPSVQEQLVAIFPGPRKIRASRCAQANVYEAVHCGDVVEGHTGDRPFVGKVETHVQVDGDYFTILTSWECLENNNMASTWDTSSSSKIIVRTADILCSNIFCERGNRVVVLKSPRARR